MDSMRFMELLKRIVGKGAYTWDIPHSIGPVKTLKPAESLPTDFFSNNYGLIHFGFLLNEVNVM